MREMFGEVQSTMRELVARVDSIDENQKRLSDAVMGIMAEEKVQAQPVLESINPAPVGCGQGDEVTGHSDQSNEQVPDGNESNIAQKCGTTEVCTARDDVAEDPILEETELYIPEKIWRKVFQYLDFVDLRKVRLISSNWKNIVDNDLSFMERFVAKVRGGLIGRECIAIPCLPASTFLFENATIATVGPWWSPRITAHLFHLELKDCKLSLINLKEMLQHTPNLRSLKISCVPTLIYHEAVDNFPEQRLEKMESLELDCVEQSAILRVLAGMFPSLKVFKIMSGYDKCRFGFVKFILRMHTLEEISLPGTPFSISDLAETRCQFKRVTLSISTKVDAQLRRHLVNFAERQSLLESFSLRVNGIESIQALQHSEERVFRNFSKLKRLSLSICNTSNRPRNTEVDLHAMNIGKLTKLEYFSFSGVQIHAISFGVSNPKLKELHLSSIDFSSHPHNIALHDYIAYAPDLHTMTMDSCFLNSWSDIFVPTQLRMWRHLELNQVTEKSLDDDGIYEYFDNLRYLKLTNCNMSKTFISTMFTLCPQVEELYLTRMFGVDDSVLPVLIQNMKQLRKLTIQQCFISARGVVYLTEHAKNIKQLNANSTLPRLVAGN